MANTPSRAVVIGLDCAMPHLVEKHISEGCLPTFKRLIERGVIAANCLAPFPTVTPPNWAAIATGAWAGTHGVTDFHNHEPGDPLDNDSSLQNWDGNRLTAEYIWETLDRAGKRCVVLNYPSSWPTKMQNGIVVGGNGMTLGEDRVGLAHLAKAMDVCADFIITTDYLPQAFRGEFAAAEGWDNLPETVGEEPLEMRVEVPFPMARVRPEATTWWVLLHQDEQGDYVRATLSPCKDYAQAFCTLDVGQWSQRIETGFAMSDGTSREVFFKCKLIQLDAEAEEFKLLVGAMIDPTRGCHPPEVAADLAQCRGCIHFSGGMVMGMLGVIDLDTYVEMNENLSAWLSDAAAILITKHQPDLLFMHSHPIDWMYHLLASDLDGADEAKKAQAWEVHRRIYECEDKLLARILEACDRNTLVTVVSDHGATADGPVFDPYAALVPAGLAVLAEEEKPAEGLDLGKRILSLSSAKLDFSQSKAVANREIYIYVNLKGRDPQGIVEPADYESVQQEIIDALLTYVDPGTGKRPVALALSRRDARLLGLYGDRVGDVVYAVYPWFGAQHGQILPTAEHGMGKLRSLLIMQGPGIKKAQRLERNCWLPDLVPTLCYLMDWPVPPTAEGAVIYQAFKDPDMKAKEVAKLKESLARLEAAVNREGRAPWDHHDCA
ncbi:MAG: alkaline phosphatase family protein [Pseudomonadota bacterium]